MPQYRLWSERITADDVLGCYTPDDVGLTRAEIAIRLGVSRNKTLVALIEQMVSEGVLHKHEDMLANRAVVFVYTRA